jgi:hypothetical protein
MRRRIAMGFALMCACARAATPMHVANAAPDSAPGCHLTRLADLDLNIAPGGVVLVPVSVNGNDAWMWLATNYPFSFLTDQAANGFNLPRQALSTQAQIKMGEKPVSETVVVDSLKIGNVEYRKSILGIVPYQRTGAPQAPAVLFGRAYVGVLGLDLLRNVDFELNLAARKLSIFSQDHCRGAVVYWTRNLTEVPLNSDQIGSLYFPLELDGKWH